MPIARRAAIERHNRTSTPPHFSASNSNSIALPRCPSCHSEESAVITLETRTSRADDEESAFCLVKRQTLGRDATWK
jgi:hypothetical protein